MGKSSWPCNGQAKQTVCGRVSPSPEQRDFLQQQGSDLADYLKGELSQHGYRPGRVAECIGRHGPTEVPRTS